jgi:DNA primase
MITKEDLIEYFDEVSKKDNFLIKNYSLMLKRIKDKRVQQVFKKIYDDKIWHKEMMEELSTIIKDSKRL